MKLLTVTDVAERLNLSVSAVYSRKEEIGYLKLGGAIRFEEGMIQAYLDANRHGRGEKARDWPVKCRPVKLKHLSSSFALF